MYIIERQNLGQPGATWQPVEGSWEMANHFALPEMAESVVRALALRSDGGAAFRVADSTGHVHLVAQVTKYLRVSQPHSSTPFFASEEIPPQFTVPLLYQVLADKDARATVFLAVRAIRSVASPAAKQCVEGAQIDTSLLPLLKEQLAIFTNVACALRKTGVDDCTEAASEQVARCDTAIDKACTDIEQALEQILTVLGDVAVLLSSPETRDLVLTLTLLTNCLIDWLELDEGCTCAGSSSEYPCLTCSSRQAVTQVRHWVQLLMLSQASDGEERKTTQVLPGTAGEEERSE